MPAPIIDTNRIKTHIILQRFQKIRKYIYGNSGKTKRTLSVGSIVCNSYTLGCPPVREINHDLILDYLPYMRTNRDINYFIPSSSV